ARRGVRGRPGGGLRRQRPAGRRRPDDAAPADDPGGHRSGRRLGGCGGRCPPHLPALHHRDRVRHRLGRGPAGLLPGDGRDLRAAAAGLAPGDGLVARRAVQRSGHPGALLLVGAPALLPGGRRRPLRRDGGQCGRRLDGERRGAAGGVAGAAARRPDPRRRAVRPGQRPTGNGADPHASAAGPGARTAAGRSGDRRPGQPAHRRCRPPPPRL
ncbi:MAG: hypothetical protein AVDCRST_MAG61-813, partial [uncultured Friedmanniella sp.]